MDSDQRDMAGEPEPSDSVPGIGGPGSGESQPDGQRALKLHAGISVIGGILSVFVTVVFFLVLDSPGPGIAFAVVAVATFGWLGWSLVHLRRGRRRGASGAP